MLAVLHQRLSKGGIDRWLLENPAFPVFYQNEQQP